MTYQTGGRRVIRADYTPGAAGFVVLVTDVTDRHRAEEAVRRSEERYRAFVGESGEGIWRVELEEPVPAGLPLADQVTAFDRSAYLAECGDTMARMYGYAAAADLVGVLLPDLFASGEPRNDDHAAAFVRSGYRLTDAPSFEWDQAREPWVFLNSLVGVVEGGCLIRAWGTQRDLTDRWLGEEALTRLRSWPWRPTPGRTGWPGSGASSTARSARSPTLSRTSSTCPG